MVIPPAPHSVTLNLLFPSCSHGKPDGPILIRERPRPKKHRARVDGRVESQSFPSNALSEFLQGPGRALDTPALGPLSHLPIWKRCHQVPHFLSLAPNGGRQMLALCSINEQINSAADEGFRNLAVRGTRSGWERKFHSCPRLADGETEAWGGRGLSGPE